MSNEPKVVKVPNAEGCTMTLEEALKTLKWHADHSTHGKLADSCRSDMDWEEAYRTVFGEAPSYHDLMLKINETLAKSG